MMKFLFLLAFVGLSVAASLPESPAHVKQHGVKNTNLEVVHPNAVTGAKPMDWLTDLILQLLGITAAQLLKLINTTFIGIEMFINDASEALKEVISEVDEEIVEKIGVIINVALEDVLAIMKPFREKLEKVLPAISRENTTMDIVSEIIYAMLGITLEELLTTVTTALGELEAILTQSLKELRQIAQEVSPEVAEQIEKVNEAMLEDTEVLLKPLINKLNQIFPQEEDSNNHTRN